MMKKSVSRCCQNKDFFLCCISSLTYDTLTDYMFFLYFALCGKNAPYFDNTKIGIHFFLLQNIFVVFSLIP